MTLFFIWQTSIATHAIFLMVMAKPKDLLIQQYLEIRARNSICLDWGEFCIC